MSYEDQLEGFAELLEASGVDLTFSGAVVACVVERDGNAAQPFDLDPGNCQQIVISALKTAFPTAPTIGDYFEDDEGGRYRITARRPNPGRPVAKYICEYSASE